MLLPFLRFSFTRGGLLPSAELVGFVGKSIWKFDHQGEADLQVKHLNNARASTLRFQLLKIGTLMAAVKRAK